MTPKVLRSARALIAVLALPVLVLPAAAQAVLPKTSDHTIIVNRSIGGVGPGMTMTEVRRQWGPQGDFGASGADYPSPGNYRHDEETGLYWGGASAARVLGKAFQVSISTDLQEMGSSPLRLAPIFDTPLSKFHTSAGIHLGSPGLTVPKAYPQVTAKRYREGAEPGVKYRIPPHEGFSTEFNVRAGRVWEITIEAGKFG